MIFLLDVNVLVALIDPRHIAHDPAHRWFNDTGRLAWATCPMTQNGVLRIVGHPRYPDGPGSPAPVAAIIATMTSLRGHAFWPDDISLLSPAHVDVSRVVTSAQVTDSYLLALAAARGGQLATFDRRLSTKAVKKGERAVCLIPA